MLRDRPRTVAYMSFCEKNKDLFKDKVTKASDIPKLESENRAEQVVLDVGCGSGILSLFAARCGAKRVIGIDNADIIVKARAAVKRNGYDHVITLIQVGKRLNVLLISRQLMRCRGRARSRTSSWTVRWT